MDSWEDKTTKEKRSRMKVVVDEFQVLGDGQKRDAAAGPQQHDAPGRTTTTMSKPTDDISF